jgi:hypothetical protein
MNQILKHFLEVAGNNFVIAVLKNDLVDQTYTKITFYGRLKDTESK